MAIKSINVGFRERTRRMASGAYDVKNVLLPSSATSVTIPSPVDGRLVLAKLSRGTLHNDSNRYATVVAENKSRNDNKLIDHTTTNGAQYGKLDLVLGPDAERHVRRGDFISVAVTVTGTPGATNHLALVFEAMDEDLAEEVLEGTDS
jgi:hypothetical protein